MTNDEMMTRLSKLTGETDEDVLLTFLDMAGDKILAKRFPYSRDVIIVPEQYHSLQLEIAVYLLNKRGAEGEISHNEDGVDRQYESADVPPSMLSSIIPCGKVINW